MADLAKLWGVDIANISKVWGVDKANLASIGGLDVPAPGYSYVMMYAGYQSGTGVDTCNNRWDAVADSWAVKADMTAPARYCGHGVSSPQDNDGYCYTVGGSSDNNTTCIGDNDRYDHGGDSWSAMTDGSVQKDANGIPDEGNGGHLHTGGYTITTNKRYDKSGNNWTAKTDQLAWTSYGIGVGDGSYCYSYTGNQTYTANGKHNWKWDVSGNSWTALTNLSETRTGQGNAGGIKDDLTEYLAGGGNNPSLSSVEIYTISTDSWATATSMSAGVRGSTANQGTAGAGTSVMAGHIDDVGYQNDNWLYSWDGDSWAVKTDTTESTSNAYGGTIV